MYFESKKRSFAKSLSYRVVGTVTTTLIAFALTQKAELAVAAGVLDTVCKILLYFLHERVWAHVRYGELEPRGAVLWLTGLSSSGKSTLAKLIVERLKKNGVRVVWLDGDQIRQHFPKLGFSREERNDHIRRVALTASLLEQQGAIVIVSLISPYKESRHFAREVCAQFHEIYLNAGLETCKARDTKGLYARAERGEVQNMTGIQDVYEAPLSPELTLETGHETTSQSLTRLANYLRQQKIV